MVVEIESELHIIDLPTLADFGADVLHVIEATPVLLSPDGSELLVAVSINTSTSGQKTEYLVYDTQRQVYEVNLAEELGKGDASTVNITAIDACWVNGDLVVAAAYEDLLDNTFSAGYSNKVAVVSATSTQTDVIEAITGEVANGAVTALALDSDGDRVVIQTSASNLLTQATDANDAADIYSLDITNSTISRISVLSDGTELSSAAQLLGVAEAVDGSLQVAFQTSAAEFATDDSNSANDIYLSAADSIHLLSADAQGVAQGASSDDLLGMQDKVFYVSDSSAITSNDSDAEDDVFLFANGSNTLVSGALDQLVTGAGFTVDLVELVSASELVISVQDASYNGTDVSGQLLLMDTQANTLSPLSVDANDNVGDDVSVNYLVVEDNKNSFVYQTYATNIAGYVVPAMVTNIQPSSDTIGPMGITSSIPVGAYNVAIDDVWQFELSEWAELGDSGFITLYEGETDTVAAQIGVDKLVLAADGMSASFDLTGYLQANTYYSFSFDEGMLIDSVGNPSPALNRITLHDEVLMNFTTGSQTKAEHGGQYFVKGEVWGFDGVDTIIGTEYSIEVYANGGNDIIVGSNKWDVIYGGRGDDTITAGEGADFLSGGMGSDTFQLTVDGTWGAGFRAINVGLNGDVGSNQIAYIDGMNQFQDVILSQGDADGVIDTLKLTDTADAFFLHDSISAETAITHTVNGRISGVEVINAGAGDDLIDLTSTDYSLSSLNMQLNGEAGNDVLWAAQGDDTLNGGAGDDVLFGGSGNDTLSGGAGADVFEFTLTSGNDVITDYDVTTGDVLKFYVREAEKDVVLQLTDDLITWDTGAGQNVTITLSGVTSTSTISSDISDTSADLIIQLELI